MDLFHRFIGAQMQLYFCSAVVSTLPLQVHVGAFVPAEPHPEAAGGECAAGRNGRKRPPVSDSPGSLHGKNVCFSARDF